MYLNRNFKVTEAIYASQSQRFANFVIDYIAKLVLTLIIAFVVGLIAASLGKIDFLEAMENINKFEEYIIGLVITLLYYNVIEILTGKSIGKFFTKTIVVMEDGTKPPTDVILVRTLCRLIPFEGFSFISNKPHGWHDSISKTFVVKEELLKEKMSSNNEIELIGTEE